MSWPCHSIVHVDSFPGQLLKFSKAPRASSYGLFIARKEFWSQWHILPLLHYHSKTTRAQPGTLTDRWGGRCLRPIKSLRIDLMDRSSRSSLYLATLPLRNIKLPISFQTALQYPTVQMAKTCLKRTFSITKTTFSRWCSALGILVAAGWAFTCPKFSFEGFRV